MKTLPLIPIVAKIRCWMAAHKLRSGLMMLVLLAGLSYAVVKILSAPPVLDGVQTEWIQDAPASSTEPNVRLKIRLPQDKIIAFYSNEPHVYIKIIGIPEGETEERVIYCQFASIAPEQEWSKLPQHECEFALMVWGDDGLDYSNYPEPFPSKFKTLRYEGELVVLLADSIAVSPLYPLTTQDEELSFSPVTELAENNNRTRDRYAVEFDWQFDSHDSGVDRKLLFFDENKQELRARFISKEGNTLTSQVQINATLSFKDRAPAFYRKSRYVNRRLYRIPIKAYSSKTTFSLKNGRE